MSRPASTENPAAPTALSGPATLNAACLNPRYSAKAPAVPATPASTPQASAAAAGRCPAAANGTAATATAAATTEAIRVTWITLAPRVARPAVKSEPP